MREKYYISKPISPDSIIHHGFDDPARLGATTSSEEEKLACYRKVHDDIRTYVETLPDSLPAP